MHSNPATANTVYTELPDINNEIFDLFPYNILIILCFQVITNYQTAGNWI